MKSAAIRETFLRFFESKQHSIVTSSPVVPGDDPTLLFTNAGMNQFKDVFLGFDKRPYQRAVTAQKCIRAGGKHNDLENVGYTARHHTFFEMLGNFSFGDYFKQDAIRFAWELLTVKFGLPEEKLWVTVYQDDDEAWGIWNQEIGVPSERIIRIGDKGGRYQSDNFWMMGDTGPCGPCSEIFFDHGEAVAGGPPGSPDEDGDRYIEIWNLVFMQFNRDDQGNMNPLPKPSVDTGMGLERVAAVLQHKHSNYEIDLFQNLLAAAASAVKEAGGSPDADSPSLKVLADHIRACAFTVVDGVIPGNEGRGYVLRRITRRAIRHGYKLGARQPFFHTLVTALADEMGDAYPELRQQAGRITEVLKQEESRFFETIANGMEMLEAALAPLKAQTGAALDGELAFKLHDTFGFPLDLTADVCRENQLRVDEAGFDAAMNRQREKARSSAKFKMSSALEYTGVETDFRGYESLGAEGQITGLYFEGQAVQALSTGQRGVVVLDQTPFYAESGGQVGDRGQLLVGGSMFRVEDTQKIQAQVFGHHGVVQEGEIRVGDSAQAQVDTASRASTMRNHSATHLMHKALREVLGDHVQQKGSLVDADKTRFDFSHNAPVSREQLHQIQTIVNREILLNEPTTTRMMSYDDAIKTGAMALFGEKYGDEVRVLQIGSSCELCGGTHVMRTGDIGLFRFVSEGGVAAGVRRVEAVTGENALDAVGVLDQIVDSAAASLKSPVAELPGRIQGLSEQVKTLEKELSRLKSKMASAQGGDLASEAVQINGVAVLAAQLEGADVQTLRETMDQLKNKLKTAALVLASSSGDKVTLIAGVTANATDRIKAGELVNHVALQVGGKGGGRPEMAQAGGNDAAALPAALASVQEWVAGKLG
ncbi:MAG: alanine--tRNA ligase [Burkholderiaceae bacterium]